MAPLVAGRAATVVAAAATALVLAAAPALASVTSLTEDGDTVVISSNAAGDAITVSCVAGLAGVNGEAPEPNLGCEDVVFVDVDANAGADTVDLGALTTSDFARLKETSVDVVDVAADSVTGSEVRDLVHADGADDVSTGLGDDWVEGAGSASGGPGNDTLRGILGAVQGGPGDDLIVSTGAGPFDGGEGSDRLVIDYSTFTSQVAVGFTITDTSINGSTPTASIEDYDITASDGVKADSVDGRLYSGRVTFHARAGDDTFRGGPGADVADMGAGNDSIDAGPGFDFVLAGDGDDSITARDGFGDVVECGPGTDNVVADRSDVLSGCETVVLPPPETSRIDGPTKVTKGTKAFFVFAASVTSATFECQVDAGVFKACSSPLTVKTRKLPRGKHTVTVRAVQPAGNADATPSSFKFKVKPKPKAKPRPSAHA